MTIWFPVGFVHFASRLSGNGRHTMGIGGYIPLCSAITQWAKILAPQLAYPNSTNEKVTKTAFTSLLVVLFLVREAGAQGMLEEFGGEKNVANFQQNAQLRLSISLRSSFWPYVQQAKSRLKVLLSGSSF